MVVDSSSNFHGRPTCGHFFHFVAHSGLSNPRIVIMDTFLKIITKLCLDVGLRCQKGSLSHPLCYWGTECVHVVEICYDYSPRKPVLRSEAMIEQLDFPTCFWSNEGRWKHANFILLSVISSPHGLYKQYETFVIVCFFPQRQKCVQG